MEPIARKNNRVRLSTGHTIELTSQEERMLKIAYDYLSGFAKRSQKESTWERKKDEVANLFANLPSSARVSVLPKPADFILPILSVGQKGDNLQVWLCYN